MCQRLYDKTIPSCVVDADDDNGEVAAAAFNITSVPSVNQWMLR